MTSPISGSSSTSSAQYTSGIESTSRPASGMNAVALQKWLESQIGAMWDKVSDATNGVDARNKSQEALTALARKASNNEPITAQEVRDVANALPEGATRDNVLALISHLPSQETIDQLQQKKDATAATAADLTQKEAAWNKAHPWDAQGGSLSANNPYKLLATGARALALEAAEGLSAAQSQTVSGTNVADGLEGAASALDKQNSLAMTELQYIASTAQQAMSLVGNILKIQGDSAKETISRIS